MTTLLSQLTQRYASCRAVCACECMSSKQCSSCFGYQVLPVGSLAFDLSVSRGVLFAEHKAAFWASMLDLTASSSKARRKKIRVNRLLAAEARNAGAATASPSSIDAASSIVEQAFRQLYKVAPVRLRQPSAPHHLGFEVQLEGERAVGEGTGSIKHARCVMVWCLCVWSLISLSLCVHTHTRACAQVVPIATSSVTSQQSCCCSPALRAMKQLSRLVTLASAVPCGCLAPLSCRCLCLAATRGTTWPRTVTCSFCELEPRRRSSCACARYAYQGE